MAIVKVTPTHLEQHGPVAELVLIVETPREVSWRRVHKWYAPVDVTVEQICSAIGAYFGVEEVDFQPPLFSLPTKEYHAADYLP